MAESGIFISSCSRRQLARRRPTRTGVVRLQILMVLIVLGSGLGAVLAARGGI